MIVAELENFDVGDWDELQVPSFEHWFWQFGSRGADYRHCKSKLSADETPKRRSS